MKNKKKVIKLNESDLHRIISESIKYALNEISPEKRGAAFVKANNFKAPETKTMMKGNRVVDTEYEKQRKERQKDLFGNSVARDIGKTIGKDRGAANEKEMRYVQMCIDDRQKIIDNPRSTEGQKMVAQKDIEQLKQRLMGLKYDTLGFSLYGSKDGYQLSDKGNNAYAHNTRRAFSYDDPREANRASQMQNYVDRLMGYDDEINNGEKLNGEEEYWKVRRDNNAALEKYHKDKDEWERNKSKADAEMSAYQGKNPISKLFSKKPQKFTEPEPTAPKWDKRGGGVYFPGTSKSNEENRQKQADLNNHYRNVHQKFNKK